MVKVYLCRAMTGMIAADVVKQAKQDKSILESYGFTVLCPVIAEKVEAFPTKIGASKKLMDTYWFRDKEMIREANVVFDMSPHVPSLGVIREHGYARYHLWKKTISVFPPGKIPKEGAVCHYEDDYVTDSLMDAAYEAYRTHGTLWRRLKWRLGVYNRSWLRAIWYRLCEWK